MWTARELEHLKIVKAPNLLGRVYPDNFVNLSFFLSSKLCAILAPLAALLLRASLLGSISDCMSFLLSQSSWIWIPAFHRWLESQSLQEFCLS